MNFNQQTKIRVLVVDDSSYMRFILSRILEEDPDIEVVGRARDGIEALAMLPVEKPDVITLDVEMPRLNGFETLERIFSVRPTPVVMVSQFTEANAETTMKALELGAVDFVQKPQGSDALTMAKIKAELISKVKVAARVTLSIGAYGQRSAQTWKPAKGTPAGVMKKVVVIASSTGGPKALADVMTHIPADAPLGILIVQHMPEGFTASLANRLNTLSPFAVSEAKEGDTLAVGRALLAPGNFHMRIRNGGRVYLSSADAVNNVRPAADVTMCDAADLFRDRVIGVVLTGMGTDGTRGGTAIREKGGVNIAQHGATCVVDGMPSSLVKAGQADRVAPLDRIALEILALI